MPDMKCPSCGQDDRLYSVERVVAEYEVVIDTDAKRLEYTGCDTRTFDEANDPMWPGFVTFHCRGCDAEWDAPDGDHTQVLDLRKVGERPEQKRPANPYVYTLSRFELERIVEDAFVAGITHAAVLEAKPTPYPHAAGDYHRALNRQRARAFAEAERRRAERTEAEANVLRGPSDEGTGASNPDAVIVPREQAR